MLAPEELAGYLDFAKRLTAEARQLVLVRRASGFTREIKADSTVVTDVDREVEQLMRRRIGQVFPGHGILGEEFAAHDIKAEYQWVIDPIDGTEDFACGIPTFGTILALHWRGQQVLGLIDHQALDLCYSAARGLGAYCNQERLRLVDVADLDAARREVVCLSGWKNFEVSGEGGLFQSLMRLPWSFRAYGNCFGHTRTIHGQSGATISYNVCPWDIAASQVLVEEAGGRFCWLRPCKDERGRQRYSSVFGKPLVVEALLAYLR